VHKLGLESAHFMLKDWGDHWGVTRNDGPFHRLEKERKDLIMEIIFQLHDSREQAITRLRKCYGEFDEGNHAGAGAGARGNRLLRLIDNFETVAQNTRKRLIWVSRDDKFVSTLTKETMKLHGWLEKLTSMSITFLATHFNNARDTELKTLLASVDHLIQETVRARGANLQQLPAASISLGDDVDGKTLAGFTTNSIMSSQQKEYVLEQIDRSQYYHGDERVPKTVTSWWNEKSSSILILELLNEGDSEAASSICVLLHNLARCHKFIFIFDAEFQGSLIHQFVSMIRTFIQNILSLRGNMSLNEPPLSMSIADMNGENTNASNIEDLVRSFHSLLRGVLESVTERILIIVGGLDVTILDDGNLMHLVCLFVSGIQDTCNSRTDGGKAGLQLF
jgi:hypothetical protein